jgi:hypothetical protein
MFELLVGVIGNRAGIDDINISNFFKIDSVKTFVLKISRNGRRF